MEAAATLYVSNCAACHGPEGHGDGPAADQLYPKPRALRDSPLRFASTGSGEEQVLRALERTIREGVRRSSMPGFGGVLTEAQMRGLAIYVKTLGTAASAEWRRPSQAEKRSTMPSYTPGYTLTGAELFRSLNCVGCHGEKGMGDGPQMAELVDSLDRPIHPANLASGQFKSGGRPEDLYRSIVNGVPGTPMPAFGMQLLEERPDGSLSDDKVWALVLYVQSLDRNPQRAGSNSGAEIVVQERADAAMMLEPSHPGWLNIAHTRLALRPTWERPEATRAVEVAVVRAGDEIAVRLWWDDATINVGADSGEFPDAAAVMFAMTDTVPAIPMGVQVPGYTGASPVNIWQWKASRQFDAAAGFAHDSDEPRIVPPGEYHAFTLVPPRPVEDAPVSALGMEFDQDYRAVGMFNRGAEAAGNPKADPELVGRAVLEANAEGFGTLLYQPSEKQQANSTAVFSNGHWFVTMFRTMSTDDVSDINLTRPRRIPVAFAIWDGTKSDRAGQKLITGWHWLVIEPDSTAGIKGSTAAAPRP